MTRSLKNRQRRDIKGSDSVNVSPSKKKPSGAELNSDLEIFSKEVLKSLIKNNLPPTPNNFSLYFDRLLEDKSENFRKQIMSMLELEENNDAENTISLEQNLRQSFSSIKSILNITAALYKNISLMTKILQKRKDELDDSKDDIGSKNIISALGGDVLKLNSILKKQNISLKSHYDETAKVIKNVENETIFDNKYGVYNKRYLLTKIEQETALVSEFKHSSSLIMIELSKKLIKGINNEKATILMTRTVARLLLKTSRRSDTVAYYGGGQFSMLLKHTSLENAKKTSERLVDLVSNSNFFLADNEIKLKLAIGITDINSSNSVEEIIINAMDGIEKAYLDKNTDFAVSI
ncbi:MAG: GGDEF domain-containing protein [Sulfurimonas sp.]|nr:GGDEF domain-containing protein [Sulfurimonas sp.]